MRWTPLRAAGSAGSVFVVSSGFLAFGADLISIASMSISKRLLLKASEAQWAGHRAGQCAPVQTQRWVAGCNWLLPGCHENASYRKSQRSLRFERRPERPVPGLYGNGDHRSETCDPSPCQAGARTRVAFANSCISFLPSEITLAPPLILIADERFRA